MSIDLPIPPGYSGLVPLDREAHAGMGKARNTNYQFALEEGSIYLTIMEFFEASKSYPVVFARDGQSEEYTPLAITGMTGKDNLFVSAAGDWLPGHYVPAYIRRWPFFNIRARQGDGAEEAVLVCVDEQGLSKDTETVLFDSDGAATPAWEPVQKLMSDLDAAQRLTLNFTRSLSQYDLLEPFEAHAQPKEGEAVRMQGLFRVNEDKLNKLPGKAVKEFMRRGELARIYAHLMSLDNFAALLDRRAKGES